MDDLIPIPIMRRDERDQEVQAADSEGIIVVVIAVSTAGYTGRELVLRILCGSIWSLLDSIRMIANNRVLNVMTRPLARSPPHSFEIRRNAILQNVTHNQTIAYKCV